MANNKISIIDYGMGNIRSVSKALELVGAKITITNNPKIICSSSAIVLPGVGSFGPAIKYLKNKKIDKAVLECISNGKHFLGLCLGFQLLFDFSKEGGRFSGLGLVSGNIEKFSFANTRIKIPHMGWNQVKYISKDYKRMFNKIPDNSYFYFVHSYYGNPINDKCIGAVTKYGKNFCSAIINNNVWACQFHPEKSGNNGLQLLKNFVSETR